MLCGNTVTVLNQLKEMIKEKVESIDFNNKDFETNGVEEVQEYTRKVLDLINGLYQDYITGYFNNDDIIRIKLGETLRIVPKERD